MVALTKLRASKGELLDHALVEAQAELIALDSKAQPVTRERARGRARGVVLDRGHALGLVREHAADRTVSGPTADRLEQPDQGAEEDPAEEREPPQAAGQADDDNQEADAAEEDLPFGEVLLGVAQRGADPGADDVVVRAHPLIG